MGLQWANEKIDQQGDRGPTVSMCRCENLASGFLSSNR